MIALFLTVVLLVDPLADPPVLRTRIMHMIDPAACAELAQVMRTRPLVIHASCSAQFHP